jgi:hypothetical protein
MYAHLNQQCYTKRINNTEHKPLCRLQDVWPILSLVPSHRAAELEFCKLLWTPDIDSPSQCSLSPYLQTFMEPRNRIRQPM